jgi:hypothetical protein
VNISLGFDEAVTVLPSESTADQLPVPSVNVTVSVLLSPLVIELEEAVTVAVGKGLFSQGSLISDTVTVVEGGSVAYVVVPQASVTEVIV